MSDLLPFVYPLWLLLLSGLQVLAYVRRPGAEAGAAVTALEKAHQAEIGALRDRVVQLEALIKHVPSREELADLEGNIKALAANIEGMTERVQAIAMSLQRIENFMLQAASMVGLQHRT